MKSGKFISVVSHMSVSNFLLCSVDHYLLDHFLAALPTCKHKLQFFSILDELHGGFLLAGFGV